MRLLTLSSNGLKGRRFNGYDLHTKLKEFGVESTHASFWDYTDNSREPWHHNIKPKVTPGWFVDKVRRLEEKTGWQNTFQFWSSRITRSKVFKRADVVHLNIVHDHWMRLEDIADIASKKPVVWTWHDLFMVTGHCIQPGTCPRWSEGCGECPDLGRPLLVESDRTANQYKRKAKLLANLNLDVHVTTNWMAKAVESHLSDSPIRLHRFPFGFSFHEFAKVNKRGARRELGLDQDSFVVFARATLDPIKNFIPLLEALSSHPLRTKVVVLGVGGPFPRDKVPSAVKTIIFPWVDEPGVLSQMYSASDVFFQASLGESFGLMALEAMWHGLPVLTQTGTATAEIVDESALEIRPLFFRQDLENVLTVGMNSPAILKTIGSRAAERARTKFSEDRYHHSLVGLYEQAIERYQRL